MQRIASLFAVIEEAEDVVAIVGTDQIGCSLAHRSGIFDERHNPTWRLRHAAMIGRPLPEPPRPATDRCSFPVKKRKIRPPDKRSVSEYPDIAHGSANGSRSGV